MEVVWTLVFLILNIVFWMAIVYLAIRLLKKFKKDNERYEKLEKVLDSINKKLNEK
ncbi:hypothetical protein [Alkaliphilus metalliredigens]|uniref:hypothetical protein n=1 Tax=Alkaliphilus metalliredigens TaxID=208226 RepID=UPI00031549F9|nr:hypothetical protein [Alkaliphilus metalliredigens]